MPLQTRFYEFERSRPPDVVGVYELGWRDGSIVYIGSGVICTRLCDHQRDPDKRFSLYRCRITKTADAPDKLSAASNGSSGDGTDDCHNSTTASDRGHHLPARRISHT